MPRGRCVKASARLAKPVTEPVECGACASRDVHVVEQWPAGKRARVFACRECGLLFVHPSKALTAAHRQAIAPEPDSDHHVSDSGAVPDAGRAANAPTKRSAARALVAALDQHFSASRPPQGARVLQIGLHTGAWGNAFAKYGWETHALEPFSNAASDSHGQLDTIPTAGFDLVIVYHALERLAHPLDTLRDVSRALRPGGYGLISVPRLDTLGVHGQIRYCLRPGKHITAFTEACLRGLAARAGLQAVTSFHDLDDAFTPGQPLRLRLLVRKAESTTALPSSELVAALEPVLEAVSALVQSPGARGATTPARVRPTECPACAARDLHIVEEWKLSGNRAHAVACSSCGLLFTYPQPLAEELRAYYAPEGGWQASRPAQSAKAPRGAAGTAVPVILDALDEYLPVNKPAGARVLDFGCGPGNWLDAFQDRGWNTYGLEPSSDAAFTRHKRLLAIPHEPQFDLALAYHVLEHLPRPLDTLRELGRAILPGGYCFVSVPRIDTLGAHRQVDYCLHPRHHIVAFTEVCLRNLLARSSLEVIASLHTLDDRVSKGAPLRLRLLARKTTVPLTPDPDAVAALRPVIDAFVRIRKRSA